MTDTDIKLTETTISDDLVRMRFADDTDAAKATHWIDFCLPIAALEHPTDRRQGLGDLDLQYLAEIRLAALLYVRDVIGDETQRLASLAGRTR